MNEKEKIESAIEILKRHRYEQAAKFLQENHPLLNEESETTKYSMLRLLMERKKKLMSWLAR